MKAETEQLHCPECRSQRLYKDGLRYLKDGRAVQRLLCRNCGYRFSQTQLLKGKSSKGSICRVRAASLPGRVRNLVKVEPLKERLAGATEPNIKGRILDFAWQLKKEGLSDRTIENYGKCLKQLLKKGANLLEPESVKEVVATEKNWKDATKCLVVAAYHKFALLNGVNWRPPKYKVTRKLPFIPLEKEIDSLIAYCGKKTATILQLLKETGMRIGEALRLKWICLDYERKTVTVNNPEKHGNPRIFKTSDKLIAMLKKLPKKNDRVFGTTTVRMACSNFNNQRKRAAAKLQNPRLLRITFHTLRHWKATMEYHKTRDILHVMKLLGHRRIENTLIYTQLVNFETDEYHSATAETATEARKLIEAGFEYVCTYDNSMLFRKRK